MVADGADYAAMIERVGGPAAAAQWKQLEKGMRPLQKGAALFPAAAIRLVRLRLVHSVLFQVTVLQRAKQTARCAVCPYTLHAAVSAQQPRTWTFLLHAACWQHCALTCPCCCCRSDPGIILTAARFFGPQLALTGLVVGTLTVSRV